MDALEALMSGEAPPEAVIGDVDTALVPAPTDEAPAIVTLPHDGTPPALQTLPGFDASPPAPFPDDDTEMFPDLKLFKGDAVKEVDRDSGVVLSVNSPAQPMMDATKMTFDPRIAFGLALEIHSPEEICQQFNLSPDDYNALACNPEFGKTVDLYKRELQENGVTYRSKAKLQAEMLLDTSWKLIHAVSTPAAVKADLIKWTAKMGDLEPKSSKGEDVPTFALQINLGGAA